MNEAYEFLTSESTQKYLAYVWNAVMFLSGGGALVLWNRISGVVCRNTEVQKIIDVISGDTAKAGTISTLVPQGTPTGTEMRKESMPAITVEGSKLAVNDFAEPYRTGWWGKEVEKVVFVDGEDQSSFYSPAELKRILKAAKRRRSQINAANRDERRKLVASYVPPTNKKG